MERLTQLGTVTSSRVVVEKLVIEQEQLVAVIPRGVRTRLQPRSVPGTQRRHVAHISYCIAILIACTLPSHTV